MKEKTAAYSESFTRSIAYKRAHKSDVELRQLGYTVFGGETDKMIVEGIIRNYGVPPPMTATIPAFFRKQRMRTWVATSRATNDKRLMGESFPIMSITDALAALALADEWPHLVEMMR